MSLRKLMAILAALIASAATASAQPATDAARHFAGKTIKVVVPTGPGGAYGLYGLLFAQHFGKHVPGNPAVTVEYRGGAGGIVASNYLFAVAPKDGTVIGIPLAPFMLAQLTGGANVQYDAAKFKWLGQMAGITRVFIVWSTTKVHTFQDLVKEELVVGSTGRGSETYMNPAVINAVFGGRIKIIDGYKGSGDLTIALERGEIGGMSATWSNLIGNHPGWLSEGKIRPIVQIGMKTFPGYDKVPLLQDLARSPEERQLIELMPVLTTAIGYSVLAPPGVPDDIMGALRTAFDATMKDPAFVADAGKRKANIEPADHRAIAAAVTRGLEAPKAQLERFTALIRAK